jgi:anti-anti-sigma factor
MTSDRGHHVAIEKRTGSRDGVTVLRISGPLNIHNFFEFQDLTRAETSPLLILDFEDVPYLDSAALGSIIGVHVSCGKHNRRYALVNVSDRLKTMLKVAGVHEFLVVYPSVAEAEQALG